MTHPSVHMSQVCAQTAEYGQYIVRCAALDRVRAKAGCA